jgi:tRNA threonylcarbamoyladenosine biosynthesis protein TsaE
VTGHVEVKPVGAEEAATVHAVVHAAFEARPPLDPPAAALTETQEQLEHRLAAHGGLLARVDGSPAGALVLDPVGSTMYLRRFGVVPDQQGHGVAAALIDAAVEAAEGFDDLTAVAREELPATIRFWERQGFHAIRRDPPNVELRRPLRTAVYLAPDAEAMRGLGRSIAGQLAPGDLIVLTGSLGAGKTTFTQGLGAGLGVRGAVTSPTFVIARVHPSEVGGPALVHADAYRLGGIAEIDDLDLDTSLDQAVTVVEWGEGLAEGLSESRLEINIVRSDGDDQGDEQRRVEITPVGPRWHALSFRGLG